MCDVPFHLHDHNYWRREPSRSQAGESRKRKREQESSSRALEEPPERRLRAAVLSERSPSPQPQTSAPQARLEGVQMVEMVEMVMAWMTLHTTQRCECPAGNRPGAELHGWTCQ
ncbi:uncharacterized protein AKAME5_000016300 [Lates japonicus]|uniref:Uncharacterized protein n=1 Tax=Lates japonicus TaxID=270547 RepID=A0AAD3QU27_LATJO|nr:uncharacterized protein AKAME5_000016300 [Lates japonicus]